MSVMRKPTVFIGSSGEGLDVAHAVQRNLAKDANVTIWNRGVFSAGESTLESLMTALNNTDFAVMVITHADSDHLNNPAPPRARDNVVFEAGLFMGRLGTQRTVILVSDDRGIHLPTALAGVTVAKFDRNKAADNLEAAIMPACNAIRRAIQQHTSVPERPPEAYSCFISHSATDYKFAERLYTDLQEVGVRCWLDSKQLKVGDHWRVEIDRAVRSLDKVLLVLSEASIGSGWVKREIDVALEREARSSRTILFPIRVDDSVMGAALLERRFGPSGRLFEEVACHP